MIRDVVNKLKLGIDLSEAEMMDCVEKIMTGEVSDILIASFLTAMTIKGETIEEITGGAKVLRRKAVPVNLNDLYTVDTCGTGGDGFSTYNISTTTSIVIAAAGIPVVKHGNRSVSSNCGSADVLERLGINIDLTPKQSELMVRDIGICFLFAPKYHQTMKYVAPVRRDLGFRTIFNILGPLANPAKANAQIVGVYDENMMNKIAHVLSNLGVERALVVHGKDGLDELTITCDSKVTELNNKSIKTYEINPRMYGIEKAKMKDITGGTAQENAEIIRKLLDGKKGAKRNILVLNAGAAIYVAGKADSLEKGINIAGEIIDSGKARLKLEEFIRYSNSF
ncbi:anthranilate phosphoribosyltransferase [Vallitalea sp.]|jgi:anthranilate phosphoribosyltransferase|uniref:anthranilate phosphoribosyltransferase n=1 Tax=Vallitalea sp. TaxID=1882829 RepID=UPI0025EAD544|nr:anthranilate phosphoribosyltransferase [Vallitalea sp.]MCT4687601.1 anthranilate phosphoribosyltransferase [Vallitalea sp.]